MYIPYLGEQKLQLLKMGNRVSMSIEIVNATDHRLEFLCCHTTSGLIEIPPQTIGPHITSIMKGVQISSQCTGSCGIAAWKIIQNGARGNDAHIVILWSVPYNFDIYSNRLAVGIRDQDTEGTTFKKTFKTMYHGNGDWYKLKEFKRDTNPVSFNTHGFEISGVMGTTHKCEARIELISSTEARINLLPPVLVEEQEDAV